MNTIKTFLLLGLLSALMVVLGNIFGGQTGMLIMLAISVAMNFFSYWFSDKMVIKMTGAKPLSRTEAPELYQMIDEISVSARIPSPRLYITGDLQPNAFATGRNPKNAVVAVTRGLLDLVDKSELKGVLAHEIAHIKNRDILVGSVAAMLAGTIAYAAQMAQWAAIFGSSSDDEDGGGNPIGILVMAIVAPIAAMIVQMAISRSREFHADATGAAFIRDARGLSSALKKLEVASGRIPLHTARPATAHMYISNPLRGGGLMSLFSTHPSTQARVERLQKITF